MEQQLPRDLFQRSSKQRKTFHFPACCFTNKTAAKHPSKLRFDDELALHPAVPDSATVAAVERVGAWRTRHKLHHRGSSLLDLEAVFLRTKDEARITFSVRSVRIEIDLEAVRLIERGDVQLHLGPPLHVDGRRSVLILLGGHFNDLHILARLRSIRLTGKACGDGKPAQQEQANNSQYAIQLYSPLKK
jgi:hypothetical protein